MLNIRYSDLVMNNYLKNRTIVSRDNQSMLEDIANEAGLELRLHKFKSGEDIATWIVPPRWDVREAWIKGPDGELIADYADHPLFAVPYSLPFKGKVDLETLKSHVRMHPRLDDVYFYEHRFAYNYQLRLKDWAVTLPRKTLEDLKPGEYEVCLDFEIEDGEMIVGELYLPGEGEDTIALLSDYCHPGQVNDSFSGILAMLDVIGRLKKQEKRKHSYRFFLFPETIGSAALLHMNPDYMKNTKLAIFSEFVGWGRNWKILGRKGQDELSQKLGENVLRDWDDVIFDDLFEGYGNDELVYDFAGIPSMSVQMTECDEYHSSRDAPELLVQENLDKAAEMIYQLCQIMESNATYRLVQEVPFYMTRFNLYADSIHDTADFNKNRMIMYGLRKGQSLLDLSAATGIEYNYVDDYVRRMKNAGLVEEIKP